MDIKSWLLELRFVSGETDELEVKDLQEAKKILEKTGNVIFEDKDNNISMINFDNVESAEIVNK